MRLVLIGIALIHFFAALIIPAFGLAYFSSTSLTFDKQRRHLIETGALIENPEMIGDTSDSSYWLMDQLLPQFSQRVEDYSRAIQAFLVGEGILFFVLAGAWRPTAEAQAENESHSPA
ncbi:MAG: hypothetical protein KJZ54_13665 [Phycisphaerales bacterium]|nr:hypothetical protein [Phycisphaerales bacterium]